MATTKHFKIFASALEDSNFLIYIPLKFRNQEAGSQAIEFLLRKTIEVVSNIPMHFPGLSAFKF